MQGLRERRLTGMAAAALLIAAAAAPAAFAAPVERTEAPAEVARHMGELLEADKGGVDYAVTWFEGDWSGDGVPDGLAITYHSCRDCGNSVGILSWIYLGGNGAMAPVREVEIFGGRPRDADIRPGRISVVTTMPKPGDPRCCPTGEKTWVLEP
ncbi:MAG: hypothetical protein VYD87_16905 [Pseudomonadota bacterium]|nr:hypothetical protein [Pseudomonadota bacterium]MEE3101800.1 hypothetical protein [Pseudomonadota bacterium]